MTPETKKHILDFVKGLLAAMAMAAGQAAIAYIAQVDWNHVIAFAMQAAAATAVIKKV